MKFWINTLIFNKLSDICPTLSLNGSDRRVYNICIKDFKNYVQYLDRNHLRIENKTPATQTWLDGSMNVDDIISVMMGDGGLTQNLESTKEVTEFVDMWVHWWFQKWTKRTKVIFNDKDMPFNTSKAVSMISCPFTAEEKEELMAVFVDELIRYGEICCTEIVGESLFQKAVDSSQKKEWKLEDKVNFISRLQRDAREISYTHGPLVFIKADANYYKLREWRDTNSNDVIR